MLKSTYLLIKYQVNPKKEDKDVFEAHCYSLLQLEKYDELNVLLNNESYLLKEDFVFYKAYTLYNLQRYQEALKVISSLQNPQKRHLHIEAQAVF